MDWLDSLIATVGLGDRVGHRPSELSGGQQQRVAVARALAGRPSVVFADEPTGNLDSRSGAEILGLMRRAVDELSQTIVMVSHDPTAAAHADRVVFLADGRVVDTMDRAERRAGARAHEGVRGLIAMWSTTFKGIAGHKRRFVSTCVAVVLGVAFLTATLVLGDTVRGGFDQMFAKANDGTAVVVRSSTKIGGADTGQRGDRGPDGRRRRADRARRRRRRGRRVRAGPDRGGRRLHHRRQRSAHARFELDRRPRPRAVPRERGPGARSPRPTADRWRS